MVISVCVKSKLASLFNDVIFAATEAGLGHLSVDKVNITSWNFPLEKKNNIIVGGFLPFCAELMNGNSKYKTVAIDTFENLAQLCTEWKCEELNIKDISDYKKFGAYHLVTEELNRVIRKLSQSPYGLILISHFKQEEIETKTRKIPRATISIGGKNRDVMLNICDLLLYMDSKIVGDNEIGIIRTKPSIYYEAKDKLQVLPEEIEYPLDKPDVAYREIVKYFTNSKLEKEV